MKKQEKIRFFIYGFLTSLIFPILISATIRSNDVNEIGRYQVVTSSGDHYSAYTVILDTKTGDFIEGEGTSLTFKRKKDIHKGNFNEIFNDTDIGR